MRSKGMIIVTGGAGFIGSNIVKWLNEIGIKNIIIVDSLENHTKFKNLIGLDFFRIVDKVDFLHLITKNNINIDTIFHLGACSSTTETDGSYMMKNNYEYSRYLLQYAVENKIRFIYASSASVYGNGKQGFREDRKCEHPLNLYAYTKFAFDQVVRNLPENIDTQIVGLRYFNVYGPQENHKGDMSSTVYKFYRQATSGSLISVFKGSENFLRDFVYIKDVIKVNEFFFANPHKSGIFNVGCGKVRSFSDVADIVSSHCDNAPIATIPFPNKLKGKYQEFTCADLNNLRNIGYDQDFYTLEQGIEDYIHILRENNGYLSFDKYYYKKS